MYKTNLDYLDKILEDVNFILEHTKNVSQEEFEKDPVLQDSMMFRLIQIAENASRIDKEFKEQHKEFQWGDISGLRNRIVHDYGNVNMHIVCKTLTSDIAELQVNVSELIAKA